MAESKGLTYGDTSTSFQLSKENEAWPRLNNENVIVLKAIVERCSAECNSFSNVRL